MGMEQGGQMGVPGGMPAPQGAPDMGAPMGAPPLEIKSSDLVKLYDLTSGQPDLQGQIVQMLGFEPSQYPDMPWTQMIIKEDANQFARALDIQKGELDHERALAMNPNAPTPPGMMGVEAPAEQATNVPEELANQEDMAMNNGQ